MKKLLRMKFMLLLCALIVGSVSAWGEDYTIVFKSAGSDSKTDLGTSPEVSNVVTSGTEYISSFSDCSKIYVGISGIKLGASKSAGTINFTLNDSYQENIKKIKVVSAIYGSDTGTLTLYNGSTSLKTGITPGTDYTHTFDTPTKVTSIKLSTSAKRAYITQIVITTEDPAVSSLSIKTAPAKTRYKVGESLDMTDFVLIADGVEKTSGYTMTIGGESITNGATLNSVGKKTITVAYGGKEVSQNISVGAVESIDVTTPPTKTTYDTGDSFDATGMVVTATISTGELSDPDTWTQDVTGYTIDPENNLTPANYFVTITYATKTTTQNVTVADVAVAGISLKASTTIEKAKTETLTPTFTPANATNQIVTWESDNTGVATVSASGVVTAVSAGTANITVTTEDGGKTATCVVMVVNEKGTIDAPFSVAEVINGTATGSDKYVKGFIVGSYGSGSKSNFNRSGVSNSNLALADNPDEENVNNTVALQLPSGTIRTGFNTQDKPYNIGVAQVVVRGDIDSYITTKGVRNTDSCVKVAEQVKIGSAGMATYYTDAALDYTGLTDMYAYTATVSGDAITFTRINKVPASQGVLLRNPAEAETTQLVPVVNGEAETVTENKFKGTLTDIAALTGENYYILNNGTNGLGFYKVKSTGSKVAAHRAYLDASGVSAREFLGFTDDETTGIETVNNVQCSMFNGQCFDLQGRKVVAPQKGLYIVNGKKVLFK